MANMTLWDAVSKTDPAHTKQVNQRGGFTAINANYQIMLATKQFGPIGIGWGYDTGAPIFHETLVMIPVTFWHGSRENRFGPIYGCEEWKDGKGRIDSDATKKAETDGLTKALSRLGFNADVFLGLYDDQKYVAAVRREFAEEQKANAAPAPAPETVNEGHLKSIRETARKAAVSEATICKNMNIAELPDLPVAKYQFVIDQLNITIAEREQKKAA